MEDYIRSVCVVQAISAQDEKLSQTMFLPLAERMVEKMVKEEKIEAEAEVSAAASLKLELKSPGSACRSKVKISADDSLFEIRKTSLSFSR